MPSGLVLLHFAPSGRSKCRLCNGVIALGSARFSYWWLSPCLVTSELPKASLITGLLGLVVPSDSKELSESAVSYTHLTLPTKRIV